MATSHDKAHALALAVLRTPSMSDFIDPPGDSARLRNEAISALADNIAGDLLAGESEDLLAHAVAQGLKAFWDRFEEFYPSHREEPVDEHAHRDLRPAGNALALRANTAARIWVRSFVPTLEDLIEP